jgi:hypothetical protein
LRWRRRSKPTLPRARGINWINRLSGLAAKG